MYKKFKRYNFCEKLEKDIQRRARRKDSDFILTGKWKKLFCKQDEFSVYAVDGEWVRNNLSVIFGHGGHAYVHEFIPHNEIWVSTQHYHNEQYDCGCPVELKGKIALDFFREVLSHEITEYKEMAKGRPFWHAHKKAENIEKKNAENDGCQ